MTHPFRFGLTVSGTTDPYEFVELCRKAEDLGYGAIAVSDHLDNQFSPLIALTAAAAATSTMKLVPLVLANDYRHPAVLAKEAASLDQFSQGRLELGVGAGWMRTDYDQAGIAYDRPGVRIERLAETVEILKAAFTGQAVHYAGTHYQIDGLEVSPGPFRPTGIPLLIAGGGPKVLRLAGAEADIVGINAALPAGVIDVSAGASVTATATDDKINVVKAAAGSRFAEVELHTRVHFAAIDPDRGGTAQALAPTVGLSAEEALASPHLLVGTEQQIVETLHRWRDTWGISYVGLSADAMEAMAPIVSALAGT